MSSNGDATLLRLSDPRARDVALAGGKGAALARASAAGFHVLPGFVITTTGVERFAANSGHPLGDLHNAWHELSLDGSEPLIVRSSSTGEDLEGASMAGRFRTVGDVRRWGAFKTAVREVIDSQRAAAIADPTLRADQPMAVVVQPFLSPLAAGVLFGVDPVTGRSDRLVVAAVTGNPERLVGGEVSGTRYELDLNGRALDRSDAPGGAHLRRAQLRELARLAARAAAKFGGPQDIEWAVDHDRRLWLLQSRPVTTEVRGEPAGPLLGPGPVAETFPDALSPLEVDLWVDPLRAALHAAFAASATTSPRQLRNSPVVVTVNGRVAVDLELFGETTARWRFLQRLDPRQPARRLRGAWRIGRLRLALPALAQDVLSEVDAQIEAVPALDQLSDHQLSALLDRCSQALVALHGYEALIGLVVDPGAARLTGAGLALCVLARAREEGVPEPEIVSSYPIVLALTPPRIHATVTLPSTEHLVPEPPTDADVDAAVVREALRIRARWIQELSGRAAWLLGERLAEAGVLADAESVRHLRLAELHALLQERATGQAAEAKPAIAHPVTAPADVLPAMFRLGETGRPIAVIARGARDGIGAGGGTGVGPIAHGPNPPDGAVLVVRTLDPGLASVLPRLAGLVAETGSVLAHVAILAREAGVPTVVAYPEATTRLVRGIVRVDGTSGTVTTVDPTREDP